MTMSSLGCCCALLELAELAACAIELLLEALDGRRSNKCGAQRLHMRSQPLGRFVGRWNRALHFLHEHPIEI